MMSVETITGLAGTLLRAETPFPTVHLGKGVIFCSFFPVLPLSLAWQLV